MSLADRISDFVYQAIEAALVRREPHRVHLVTSYDPETHSIKATRQPDGAESGFTAIGTGMAANGYGFVLGPTVGDQFVLGHVGGDPDVPFVAGRLFSDQDKPPVVQAGEALMKAQGGQTIFLAQDGSTTVTDKSGTSLKMDGAGNVTITNSGTFQINAATINLVGDVHLGSTGGVPAAQQGTLDTAGNADISQLATKVWTT